MCNYRQENKCLVDNSICPWVYWCDKANVWKELSKMPKRCKMADNVKVPDGYYKVEFGRHGYLYVAVDGQVFKIKNPYNDIPNFVKLYKYKNEWKIKKETKENG